MEPLIHTDVVVIGGGSAGIAATVAVAEEGKKVILIEKNNYLGGLATGAEVGTLCGLYAYSKNQIAEYVVTGFVKEFAEEIKKYSQTEPLNNNLGLHYLPYNVSVYKNYCEELMKKNNITVFRNSSLSAVKCNGTSIESLSITTNNDLQTEIKCDGVIDCSGNSIVSQLLHLDVIKSQTYQAAAQVFTLKGIEPITESLLGMVLIKEIKTAINNSLLEAYYDRISIVQGSIKNNEVSFKMAIPIEVTHSASNKIDIKNKATEMVNTISMFLIKTISVLSKSTLYHVAPEIGYRVDCRSLGNYVLTENDVLSCKKFNDAIANGSWPIEIWGQDKRVDMRFFAENDYYQIPKGCLISNKISNLFFAGRIISADDCAIASARVMGTCLQTGYAAGKLASNVSE